MLAERGIVSVMTRGGSGTRWTRSISTPCAPAPFDGTCEDLFFHVDGLIAAACGREVAGRLHTARSRNDIDMTMYRMRLARVVLVADGGDARRCGSRSSRSRERHTATDLSGAHAHAAGAADDGRALPAGGHRRARAGHASGWSPRTARRTGIRSGACAITGTGFPIDRQRTSELLGFDGPTGNTYGSIAAVDYLLESAAAARSSVIGAGRFVQDMLLWCTSEVGYLRLPDGFVQISSIMPQKRNPVALEHARALLSKALGQAGAIPLVVHNTPFGDIIDTEDDLQPLVVSCSGTRRARRAGRRGDGGAEFDVATGWPRAPPQAGSRSRSWPTRSPASTACHSERPTRLWRR